MSRDAFLTVALQYCISACIQSLEVQGHSANSLSLMFDVVLTEYAKGHDNVGRPALSACRAEVSSKKRKPGPSAEILSRLDC